MKKGRRTEHKQTWVKVNAQVDDGIAELIEVLGRFPSLETMSSCQGDLDGQLGATVFFYFGNDISCTGSIGKWKELVEFVLGYLGPGLDAAVGTKVQTSLIVGYKGDVQGKLYIHSDALSKTVRALKRLSKIYS